MKESRVCTLNKYGEKLVGIETRPSTQKTKYPTIILVHGFGVTKNEYGMFDGLAKSLSSAGFLVYRFDFSGRGESDGDYSKTSLTKQKSDLSSIIRFVKTQDKVDRTKLGVVAQSFGTCVTVALKPKVNSLVLLGSISKPKKVLGIPWKWKRLDMEGVSSKVSSDGNMVNIEPVFWKDFDKYNLLAFIRKIKCPILFVHGSEDDRVPISEMKAYYENVKGLKKKAIIAGADHGLIPHREKMYSIVVDWFEKSLS